MWNLFKSHAKGDGKGRVTPKSKNTKNIHILSSDFGNIVLGSEAPPIYADKIKSSALQNSTWSTYYSSSSSHVQSRQGTPTFFAQKNQRKVENHSSCFDEQNEVQQFDDIEQGLPQSPRTKKGSPENQESIISARLRMKKGSVYCTEEPCNLRATSASINIV